MTVLIAQAVLVTLLNILQLAHDLLGLVMLMVGGDSSDVATIWLGCSVLTDAQELGEVVHLRILVVARRYVIRVWAGS